MTFEAEDLDTPDEKRSFEHRDMRVVDISGATIDRARFNPGWKWSTDVKPLAGTDSCEAPHTGYVISGRLHVEMDDGAEGEAGPGDAFVISLGHEAGVVGDEPGVMLDWSGSANYAKHAG